MANRYLYAIAIPEQALERPGGSQSGRVSSEGALTGDIPAVESVSQNAGDQRLVGLVAGQYADLTATEFEQLFGSSGIDAVPFFGDNPDPQLDGYYATEDISVDRPASARKELQQFDGRLKKRGSRRSHRRAIRTTPTTVDNPFGTATTEEIAIPTRADNALWFDDRGGTLATESATVQRTVEGEHDRIDIYDATEPTFNQPALVYDVPYRHEWPVDVRIWDDRDNPKIVTTEESGEEIGTATVGTATIGSETQVVAWQRVYRSDHDANGTLTLENDRVRVRLDESRGRLRPSRWDASDGQYNPVQLDPTSNWRFQRANIRYIGVEAVDAQLTFSDGTSTHRLNASLKRGYDDVQFTNPPNEGAVPSGLTDRLTAIADDSDRDPGASADIIPKEEIGE